MMPASRLNAPMMKKLLELLASLDAQRIRDSTGMERLALTESAQKDSKD